MGAKELWLGCNQPEQLETQTTTFENKDQRDCAQKIIIVKSHILDIKIVMICI